MANSSFTGVSNEELVNKLGASNINAGTVTCDRLDISTPFSISSHILYITGASPAAYTLTNAQISFAVSTGYLYLYADHTGAACDINFGADTSARAAELLSLFGINNTVSSRLIRIKILNAAAAAQGVNIKNTGNTITNVQFKAMTVNAGALEEDTPATGTKTLVAVNAPRHAEGHILVRKGSPTTAGENAILFTVIEACGP